MNRTSRRAFLRDSAAGFAALGVAQFGTRQALAADDPIDIEAVHLSGNLFQISGAGGNVVVLEGSRGLLLVDSGAPEHVEALMTFLAAEFGAAPVTTLLNTHWHLPHTGANEAIGAAGARIIAHENTRLWMSTEYYVEWEDRTYSPRASAALPTDTFYTSDPQPVTFEHDSDAVAYAHMPEAHTDGDIYVRFPGQNVIVAGDVLAASAYPVPDYATGGWIGGLANASRMLLEVCDERTQVVPGAGPVQMRADLEAQLEMLETVRERVNTMMTEGKSAAEMIAEGVTADYDEKWGDPSRFIVNVYEGMWWGGRVRGPI